MVLNPYADNCNDDDDDQENDQAWEEWEKETDEHRPTVEDMVTEQKKIRVNRSRCGTCIYFEDNRMRLMAGAREQMERDADADDTWIVCHQTLPYNHEYEDALPAVCHGYFQHGKTTSWPLRWGSQVGLLEFVPPPSTEWKGGER